MARPRGNERQEGLIVGMFFKAALLWWLVSVIREILIRRRADLWPILAGALFYQVVNCILKSCWSSDPLLINTAVSLLHSTITSNSVMLVLLHECIKEGPSKMLDHEELFSGVWFGAFEALCVSCGYFAYDQWDMLYNHLYNPQTPSILIHHALLLACFTLALYRTVTINYLILTLVCELHSIFLHLRRVIRMTGLRRDKSRIMKIEWGLNWLTFFTTRLCMHWFIIFKLIKDASKFPRGVELPLAFIGMVGMNLLNIFLGRDLFKAYQKDHL